MHREKILYYLALILAIWFVISAWMWTYLTNLFLSFPCGLLSLGIWFFIRTKNGMETKSTLLIRLLGVGVLVAFFSFFAIYFMN